MRLLHVIDSMDPARGGPVESICQSAAAMRPFGHVNEVVSLDPAHASWNAKLQLQHHARGRLMQRYGYSPGFTDWVGRHHADYDAIIIHGLWTYATLGTWQALRRRQSGRHTPYVVFTHGMLDPWFGKAQPIKNVAKQLYWSAALGRVLSDAQAVLFTTEEEQRLARTSFHGHHYKEQVVAYGTADVPAHKPDQIAEFLSILPALRNRSFLLFLGRIHPKKGCDLLLRAFASYADAYPQIDLVMAGPDQMGWCERLRKLAAELNIEHRIHWTGMLSGNLKWGAFHAAEAFILPSHQENFGIAVAEAMACGKPVLISDKVNIWPDVIETKAGLVAPDDLKGTKDLLGRYLTQTPMENFAMGDAGRRCFLNRFQIKNAAEDLLAKLERIIAPFNDAPMGAETP